MMLEALALPFFQRVIVAGLLAAVACGVVGSLVVVKRMASITGGISHTAFGGVGLGYWLGFDPMAGATVFGLLAAAAIGIAYRQSKASLDTLISMFWSIGMALGIIFVALAPGYAPDLTSYLFGSILLVPWSTIALLAAFDIVLLMVVILWFKGFQAVSFDEEFAEVIGLPVGLIIACLLGLSALAVVVLIRVVGVILAIALLTIPAATARQWSSRLGRMMLLATALAAACTLAGLLLAYQLSESRHMALPPGPLIVILCALSFGVSAVLRKFKSASKALPPATAASR